jgi:hypothetical protein
MKRPITLVTVSGMTLLELVAASPGKRFPKAEREDEWPAAATSGRLRCRVADPDFHPYPA